MGEKLLYLSRDQVASCNTGIIEIIDTVEEAFKKKGQGVTELPLKPTIHPRPDCFLRALAGYISGLDVAGLKWVSAYPINRDSGLPLVSGLILLNNPETGLPLAVMDGSWITAWRTAAVSAVATRHLVIQGATTLSICGAGVQGNSHLEALLYVLPELRDVNVFDSSPRAMEQFLSTHQLSYPELTFKATSSPEEAVKGAHVVVTAAPMLTTRRAEIKGDWLAPGTLCLPLDFDSYFAPSAFAICKKFYTDDNDQLLWFKENGRFSDLPDLTGDLGHLVSGRVHGRENEDERIMVISVGVALGDLVTANLIYRKASSLNIGTWLDL